MPSDKDIVEEAREVATELGQDRKSALCKAVTHKVIAARAENTLRALADEVERLRELIVHMHVHSGYRDNGYMQMTTPQKALYDAIWQRSVEELDAEELNHHTNS